MKSREEREREETVALDEALGPRMRIESTARLRQLEYGVIPYGNFPKDWKGPHRMPNEKCRILLEFSTD